jgi:transketolase
MDGFTKDVMPVESIAEKFLAFNWNVFSIDGHDMKEIVKTLDLAVSQKNRNGKPVCIVAETIKGKGVSYMENEKIWHGKAPSESELKKALVEINGGAV